MFIQFAQDTIECVAGLFTHSLGISMPQSFVSKGYSAQWQNVHLIFEPELALVVPNSACGQSH